MSEVECGGVGDSLYNISKQTIAVDETAYGLVVYASAMPLIWFCYYIKCLCFSLRLPW